MLVIWIEDDTGYGDIYGQKINNDGTKIGSSSEIHAGTGALSHLSAAYNSNNDGYLIAFIEQESGGDLELKLLTQGNIENGDIEFEAPSLNINVNEGDTVTLTIDRTGGIDGDVSVEYDTTNGNAGSGDYTATSGTAIFVNGDNEETITISTTQDATPEGTETFLVTLSNPTGGGAGLGTSVVATVNILDDDGEVMGPPQSFSLKQILIIK